LRTLRSALAAAALLVAALLLPALAAAEPAGAGGAGGGIPPRSRWITPQFSISMAELRSMTASLPESIRSEIEARPVAFLDLMARVLEEPAGYLVLVDKAHPLPAGYAPPALVRLSDYHLAVSRNDLYLRAAIMPEVVAMTRAAREAGVVLLFSSTYRSYAVQRYVYDREIKLYGKKVADSESAVPGYSQHQLGTAIDFGSITDAFDATAASRWLAAHAWQYGFSLSYPRGYEWLTGYRYEGWHYRYIGRPAAQMQRAFFGNIQQYLLVFLHEYRAAFLKNRLR